MPTDLPKGALDNATAAVAFAVQVRKFHARRSDKKRSSQRGEDLIRAIERLREAMNPLRSEIGRFPYGPQTDQAERNRQKIRKASEAIQKERRKLWKMLTPEQREQVKAAEAA